MERTVYPKVAHETEHDDWIEIRFEVEAALHGFRIDRFLSVRIPRLSRTRIQTVIARGQLRFEDGPLVERPSQRVRRGDRLLLRRPAPIEPNVPLDYREIHRDEALLVIDKPAGLPVHPTARYHHHTLTAVMRERMGPDHGWQMAHRIDRETSGVLVFGRAGVRRRGDPPSGAGLLKRAFAQREVAKEYLAIVRGTLREAVMVDAPLAFDPNSSVRIKMGIVATDRGGLPAQTHVEPLVHTTHATGPVTLVRCLPRTGRQHQIRVHLASLGHGLLGDKLYGVDESLFRDMADGHLSMAEVEAQVGLERQALHAHALQVPHPSTGASMRFVAPWPALLEAIVALPASGD